MRIIQSQIKIKFLIFFFFFGISYLMGLYGTAAYAQAREVLTDQDQIEESVSKEINELIKSESFLKKKDKKFKNIKGYLVVDISIVQQGKLATFFKVESDINDIDFLEFIADTMLAQKFNFKLPKQQRYKIRQTIKF